MSFIDLINKKNNRISLYKLDEEILIDKKIKIEHENKETET